MKRYGKYRRKLWHDMENMDEMGNDMENTEEKVSWIVKRFGKYRRKLWNDMENMEEK